MREIDFRAWDSMFGMKKVTGIDFEKQIVKLLNEQQGESFEVNLGRIRLMQYTGLKDKADNKIFEGDIIEAEEDYGIVEWDSDELEYIFAVGNIDFKLGTYQSREIAVVGNVYEDPNFFTMRANGMCCDCLNPISYHICGDYSENKWCKSRKEDGSCWE